MLRKVVAAGVGTVAFVAMGSGTAFAGEIRGPGSPTGVPEGQSVPTGAPAHTNSICAYSGLNHLHAGEPPSRVQSYGQLVSSGYIVASEVRSGDPGPGTSCNGATGYLSGGGG